MFKHKIIIYYVNNAHMYVVTDIDVSSTGSIPYFLHWKLGFKPNSTNFLSNHLKLTFSVIL